MQKTGRRHRPQSRRQRGRSNGVSGETELSVYCLPAALVFVVRGGSGRTDERRQNGAARSESRFPKPIVPTRRMHTRSRGGAARARRGVEERKAGTADSRRTGFQARRRRVAGVHCPLRRPAEHSPRRYTARNLSSRRIRAPSSPSRCTGTRQHTSSEGRSPSSAAAAPPLRERTPPSRARCRLDASG